MKNFPDLAVLYRAEPVSHGLVLLKGTFLNSGRKDITPEMVADPVTLQLPEDFKWLAAKTVGASPGVHIAAESDSTALRFSANLFRCQEYFKFEALAEVPVAGKGRSIAAELVTSLNASHRIADTARIRELPLPPEWRVKQGFRMRILLSSGVLLIGFGFAGFMLFNRSVLPVRLHFEAPTKDGVITELKVSPRRDGTIHIESKDGSIDQNVDAQRFFARTVVRPKIVPDRVAIYFSVALLLLYVGLPIVLIFLAVTERRRWMRVRKQIGLQ